MTAPTLVDYPAVTLLGIATARHVSELPKVIPATLDLVRRACAKTTSGPPRVYYTNWKDGQGTVTIGFVATPGASAVGNVHVVSFPAGQAFKVSFDGPYSRIMEPWQALMAHVAASIDWQISGPNWEDYVDPKPVTDVYVGVRRR